MSPLRKILTPWLRRLALLLGSAALLSIAMVLLLRFVPPWTSAVMLEDRLEGLLQHPPAPHHGWHWVALKQVSPELPLALVAAEDQRFPYHHGFDFQSIDQALAAADRGRRLRGASTISQQTAKNLFLWNGRSFIRKGLEAWFTLLLETLWPKQRILEVYMNIAQFGEGIYGVATASAIFYHQPPANLSRHQAAQLAAVLPNPVRLRVDHPSAYVEGRVDWIEQQMRQLGGPSYLPFLRRH